MLSCREVVKILASDELLPFGKSLSLKLHLLVCRLCKMYSLQLQVINSSTKNVLKEAEDVNPEVVEGIVQNVVEKLE